MPGSAWVDREDGASSLEADITFELAPERGLPAVHFELFGVEARRRHRRIGRDRIICGAFSGTHLQPAFATVGTICEAVYCQTEVRKDLIVDDVVEEYGIRVEGVLRQDDAIVKCAVLADLYIPVIQESSL